jgi:hypothetical protein
VPPPFKSSPAPGNRALFIAQCHASYLGGAQVKGLVAMQATESSVTPEKKGTGQRFSTAVRASKNLSSRHFGYYTAEI